MKFDSTKRMYLPRFKGDGPGILGHAIDFDGIAQVLLEDLLLAARLASLSLVGWRVFGSLLRNIMARAGDDEVRLRTMP